MPLAADERKLELAAVVQLLSITPRGGATVRLTPGPRDGGAVRFKNRSYQAVPVRISGAGEGGRGGAKEPVLEVAAGAASVVALLAGADDLAGAAVVLLETLETYLDGAPGADATQHWPERRWTVEALAGRDSRTVKWRLASPLTLDGAKLPRRQALRDVCPWQYRVWDGTAFDYTGAECPYNGAAHFGLDDQPAASAAGDACSRRVSGCQARYPNNAVLPFGGFVGLGRNR